MEILREPRVTLIARPQFVEPPHLAVKWLGESTDGERLAEFAGRLCYMSQHNPANRSTADYLENIKTQGHGSVLEHSVYVLLIEGISRSCTHELVRHRAGFGYSQLSQRYVDESHAAFEGLMEKYADVENKMHRRKLAREAARSVLPNATETKIVVSANVRAWRTTLELRTSDGAELEIRRMAIACLRLLQREAPLLFNDFEIYTSADGRETARVRYHK